MKYINLILAIVVLSTATYSTSAQDAISLFKDAKKAYSAYEINTSENLPKLIEASEKINQAVQSDEFKSDAKALILAGNIHNKIAEAEMAFNGLDQSYELKHTDAASKAYQYFADAFENASKSRIKREAKDGLLNAASYLSALGNIYLSKQEYAKAYAPLNDVLKVDNLLGSKDEDGVFQNDDDRNNHKYVTAIAGQQAGDNDRAKELLGSLVEIDYNEPNVYSSYYRILQDEDPEKAAEILKVGKEKFPDNQDLLYAEINSLILKKDYDKLETLLQKAIEKDPENASVRNALGNVYMNLYDSHVDENPEKAQNYFDQSVNYFNQAIELDENFFDAIYSLGSLYFNKAATKTEIMANLGISNEDLKKYDELDKEVKELFNQALPYFKRAEKMNPNDANTVIALKEIYARMDNLELTKEFSTRLEKIKNGEQVESSYFKD